VNTDDDLQPKGLLIGFLVALAYTAAPDRWQLWFELVQALLSQERARSGCGERAWQPPGSFPPTGIGGVPAQERLEHSRQTAGVRTREFP
jgi:hypothetical protein